MVQKRTFELKGFKLEIESLKVDVSGDNSDVSQLTAAVAGGVAGALGPAMRTLNPQFEAEPAQKPAVVVSPVTPGEKRAGRRSPRTRAANSPAVGMAAAPLDWKPDIKKHGNPTAEWSNFDKGSWLLYCYSMDHGGDGSKGLTLPVVIATFNKHFPQAKTIQPKYLNRDFNRYEGGDSPKVTADRNQSPEVWYLTDAGTAEVVARIKQAAVPVAAA
jgi:hypothetical protein